MSEEFFHDYLKLKIINRKKIARNILEFEFSASNNIPLPGWEPGSHIELSLPSGIKRQYSLISGNIDKNNWRIAVLIEADGKGGSLEIQNTFFPGAEFTSSLPRNHFPFKFETSILFIAGGIGITPLLKMIELSNLQSLAWELIYLGRDFEGMAYPQELLDSFPDRVNIHCSSKNGRLDLKKIIEEMSQETQVYACGPESLISILEESMTQNPYNLHSERFHPRTIQLSMPDTQFTVYCQKSDIELVVPADESIIMAADFAGIDIPGDCMEGTCGACETRVFEGEVDHRDSVLSAQARAEGDTMMICISRAKGKRLVIDL